MGDSFVIHKMCSIQMILKGNIARFQMACRFTLSLWTTARYISPQSGPLCLSVGSALPVNNNTLARMLFRRLMIIILNPDRSLYPPETEIPYLGKLISDTFQAASRAMIPEIGIETTL